MSTTSQPNAERVPEMLLKEIVGTLALCRACAPVEVVHRDQHSNDFAEVRLRNGGSIVVKRGRFAWARERFRTSQEAARLIQEETDVAVPIPLPLPERIGGGDPVEAYWRLDLPTLQEVWRELSPQERDEALVSLGRLAAQLHAVETTGFGPLSGARGSRGTFEEFMESELRVRLLPAVWAEWNAAVSLVEGLADRIADASRRVRNRSRLIHGDMHMGNVLCETDGRGVRCVGLIDLETARAGALEADLAILELHHGELFDHPVEGSWMEALLRGYGGGYDRWLVHFYRVYHLLNMGFYSALIGHDWHARRVARAAEEELRRLPRG